MKIIKTRNFLSGIIGLLFILQSCNLKNRTDQKLSERTSISTEDAIPELKTDNDFDVAGFELDSMNNYGAGDCWGIVRQYSKNDYIIGIDSMLCSEYSSAYTMLKFNKGEVIKVQMLKSETLLGLNGNPNQYKLEEVIIETEENKSVYKIRTDTVENSDFELLNKKFHEIAPENLEAKIESILDEYNGVWELIEDY